MSKTVEKKKGTRQSSARRKDQTMTIELTPANARDLRWAARLARIDPTALVNDWLISNQLQDLREPWIGSLQDLVENTVYETPQEEAAVRRDVAKFDAVAKYRSTMKKLSKTKAA